jgi:hypothetical protein
MLGEVIQAAGAAKSWGRLARQVAMSGKRSTKKLKAICPTCPPRPSRSRNSLSADVTTFTASAAVLHDLAAYPEGRQVERDGITLGGHRDGPTGGRQQLEEPRCAALVPQVRGRTHDTCAVIAGQDSHDHYWQMANKMWFRPRKTIQSGVSSCVDRVDHPCFRLFCTSPLLYRVCVCMYTLVSTVMEVPNYREELFSQPHIFETSSYPQFAGLHDRGIDGGLHIEQSDLVISDRRTRKQRSMLLVSAPLCACRPGSDTLQRSASGGNKTLLLVRGISCMQYFTGCVRVRDGQWRVKDADLFSRTFQAKSSSPWNVNIWVIATREIVLSDPGLSSHSTGMWNHNLTLLFV